MALHSDLPDQLHQLQGEAGKHLHNAFGGQCMQTGLSLYRVPLQRPIRPYYQELQLPQLFSTSCVWRVRPRLWLRRWGDYTDAILWCTCKHLKQYGTCINWAYVNVTFLCCCAVGWWWFFFYNCHWTGKSRKLTALPVIASAPMCTATTTCYRK